jgi:hypothetical protein
MMHARAAFLIAFFAITIRANHGAIKVSASSWQVGSNPNAAFDGDRFATNSIWRGAPASTWVWQVDFGTNAPTTIGSILQINGDHDFVFENAPKSYRWVGSRDGVNWSALTGASVTNENRLFRTLRLGEPVQVRFARLEILEAAGAYAALREVQFFPKTDARTRFPEWIVVVNATHDPKLPGEGKEFIPLARGVRDQFLPAQQIWLDAFNDDFLRAEPRPLCAFISGSFKDWCEVRREDFRGMAEVLGAGRIPIWASCGGAQALTIIADAGVDREWDCPHCRDPKNPKTPIYTHIGHTAAKQCGDYSGCVFERGPHRVSLIKNDPVFADLGREFQVMESHCGQIAYMPPGWEWIVGPGVGTLTKHQAFRRADRPIYAAQFHIEMSGTPDTSNRIMKNFLDIAREWGGYRAAK